MMGLVFCTKRVWTKPGLEKRWSPRCSTVNACVAPKHNSYVWITTHKVMVLRSGAFRRWLGHKVLKARILKCFAIPFYYLKRKYRCVLKHEVSRHSVQGRFPQMPHHPCETWRQSTDTYFKHGRYRSLHLWLWTSNSLSGPPVSF